MTEEIVQTPVAPVVTDTVAETPVETPTNEVPVETTGERNAITEQSDFVLPEEYKDKPWAEKVKSQEDAYKQIDNLTALVGKKTIKPIDYETASPEEISAYHSSLAPESADQYKFGENSDPEFSKEVGEVYKELGLTEYQGNKLSEKVEEIASKIVAKKKEADTDLEKYTEIMKESFGDDYELKMGISEAALKQHAVSDEDKAFLNNMDNSERAVVDRTVNSLVQSYEDRIANILKEHGVTESGAQAEGGEGTNSVVDKAEQRRLIRAEMRELDGKPFVHEQIKELQAKLNKLL